MSNCATPLKALGIVKYSLKKPSIAFSLVELMVIIAILTVLIAMLLPVLVKSRRTSHLLPCVNNLKNIGLAFRTYATDHQDKFPMNVGTNQGGSAEWIAMKANGTKYLYMTFRCLTNELSTPKILKCPADKKAMALNWDSDMTSGKNGSGNGCISYGLGIEVQEDKPSMLLAMDRNITNGGAGGSAVITAYNPISQWGNLGTNHSTNSGAGWSAELHPFYGNGAVGDGSMQSFNNTRLIETLRHSGDTNNLIAIPGRGTAPN